MSPTDKLRRILKEIVNGHITGEHSPEWIDWMEGEINDLDLSAKPDPDAERKPS